jgi:hypothetical protein
MKLIKYFFIFICFILAILGDVLDFAMKIIQITIFLTVIGVLGSILIKLTIDVMISVFMFLAQIFDEEKVSYTGIKGFLVKNRKIILNFLLGTLPEGGSFILGAGFADIIPFRTLSVIIVFLLEIGIFEKILSIFKIPIKK